MTSGIPQLRNKEQTGGGEVRPGSRQSQRGRRDRDAVSAGRTVLSQACSRQCSRRKEGRASSNPPTQPCSAQALPSPGCPGLPPKPLEAGFYFRIARLLGDGRWDAVAWGRPAPSRTEGPVHWPADTSPRGQASPTTPPTGPPASLGPGVHTLVARGCLGPVHPQQEPEEGPRAPGGHVSSVLSPPCSTGRGGHWQGSKGPTKAQTLGRGPPLSAVLG